MNKHKKALVELTKHVAFCLTALDKVMTKPASGDRDKRIAKICNSIEFANDSVMHFGLGYGWKKIENIKKKKVVK